VANKAHPTSSPAKSKTTDNPGRLSGKPAKPYPEFPLTKWKTPGERKGRIGALRRAGS